MATLVDSKMATDAMTLSAQEDAWTASIQDEGLPPSKYLCLTILGYRKPGRPANEKVLA